MPAKSKSEFLRQLPSVDELLREPALAALAATNGHAATADAARAVLARLREEIAGGHLDAKGIETALAGLAAAVERQLHASIQPSLRQVMNATGVILHTNLGRAPLPAAAFERMREVGAGYSNLEFDLESGERGRRDSHADRLFSTLFAQQVGDAAAELATVVVNNNAAAVLLGLNTLAEGGEAVVSRGEAGELGGSFRLPEVRR